MRFLKEWLLIEADEDESLITIFDKNKKDFPYLNTKQQLKFLNDTLDRIPNSKNIKPVKSLVVQNFLQNGIDREENPFIYFIDKVQTPLKPYVIETIEELQDNDYLQDPRILYMIGEPSLYNESAEDTIFKLKGIALASDPDSKNKYPSKFDVVYLRKGNIWDKKSVMERKLNNWIKRSNRKGKDNKKSNDKTVKTIQDLIQREANRQDKNRSDIIWNSLNEIRNDYEKNVSYTDSDGVYKQVLTDALKDKDTALDLVKSIWNSKLDYNQDLKPSINIALNILKNIGRVGKQ